MDEKVEELIKIKSLAWRTFMKYEEIGQGAYAWPVFKMIRDSVNEKLRRKGIYEEVQFIGIMKCLEDLRTP